MYFKLKNQSEMLKKAVQENGGYRKLSEKLGIPKSALLRYTQGTAIIDKRCKLILEFLNLGTDIINERFPDNFRQKMGGLRCVDVKKKLGTFEKDMKLIQARQSDKLKKWHRDMKKNKPFEYFNIQYNRFKKIGGYKYKTKQGESVRNLFEKKVADLLFEQGIPYEYEPLISINKRYFFPDFLIKNKIILECTCWRGQSKAYKLKEKIGYFKKGYRVYVIIPKTLYRYYKILDYYLVLGLDKFVPIAQTFLPAKSGGGEQ